MAKRKAYLHIGLGDGTGNFIDTALRHHEFALAELGVRQPARTQDESFRAAIEILRTHKQWGFKRKEVEGAWSTICRRARKGKDTIVISVPLLAGASPAQIELLFDGLTGFERHVIITAAAPDAWTLAGDADRDLGTVLQRWAASARKPERVHVIVDSPGRDHRSVWTEFGRVVGFGTSSLSVADINDPAGTPSARPIPEARLALLQTLSRSWVEQLEESEYQVLGDLDDLIPGVDSVAAGVATDAELQEALRLVEQLARRNQNLELRLAEATGPRLAESA